MNTRKASIESIKTIKFINNRHGQAEDLLTVEEPMEIRLGYKNQHGDFKQKSISVTMRTPGNDIELALGFLFTEGIIADINQISSARHCSNTNEANPGNVVKVSLKPEVYFDPSNLQRNFYMTSSCGICGKASLESVGQRIDKLEHPYAPISKYKFHLMAQKLRNEQLIFKYTGGIHGAGLFDLDGNLLLSFEDIGRHNAVDKLIGAALIKNMLPLKDSCIIISGRAGFELVQKSLMAGIPILGAVGAPSNISVRLAEKYGMRLIGFIKQNSHNLYTGISSHNVVPSTLTD